MPSLETLVFANIELKGDIYEKLERILATLYAKEALVFMWTVKGSQGSIYRLLRLASDSSKKLTIFCDENGLDSCIRYSLMVSDPSIELVALVNDCRLSPNVYEKLKVAYEHGLDNVSLYLAYGSPDDARRIKRVVTLTRSWPYQVMLRVGPRPIGYVAREDVVRVRELFDELGLPYGVLYGFSARRALLENTYITLLEPPCPRGCKKLTITGSGVYKCPLDGGEAIQLDHATPDTLETVIERECKRPPSTPSAKDVRIRIIVEYNGVSIPEDVLDVLVAVRMLRSFRAACRMLGVNPAHMAMRIRRLEEKIGHRLLEGHRGGRGGGYTMLTSIGEEIVKRYLEVKSVLGG
ncbi:MAG TPA: LysR family transcriptional regulator [Pyrodictium sp.]|nr:LysR family transcriptional regulator [Pyrodictium sp.]